MSLLHDRLPCAAGYFKLRNDFKAKNRGLSDSVSPVRIIAQPNMIKGLTPVRKYSFQETLPSQ